MNLYLHIGHGKTGSSALQSFLALNSKLLENFGIEYPAHNSFEDAKKGNISSGNIPLVDDAWDSYIDKKVKTCNVENILFSNESLIHKIISHPKKIENLNKKYNLELIMYVRNPLDHIFSAYGQQVKRGGLSEDMSSWIDNYKVLDRVLNVINLCQSINVKLKLINYSKIDTIENSFFSHLLKKDYNLFINQSEVIKKRKINRSLSRVEYEIQRNFNKFAGASSSEYISDALVNNAPDVKSEKEYINDESLMNFINTNKKKVDFINTFLDDNNKLELEKPNIQPENEKFEISKKQIEVLTESISNKIKNTNNAILQNNDADILKNIAQKYEKNDSLTIEDAHYLMGLAHRARPNGPVIKQKLEAFQKELKGK